MTALMDALLGIGKLIKQAINASAEEWAEMVEKHPLGAASLLRIAAERLDARARAFKNQKGWRARRNHEVAKGLRAEALQLSLQAALGEKCSEASKAAPWVTKGVS